MKRHDQYFVYIVTCKNGTFYTGYTNDLKKRIESHNKGTGAKYLRGKGPIELVYFKEYRYYKNALKAERETKKLTRGQKEEIVKKHASKKI